LFNSEQADRRSSRFFQFGVCNDGVGCAKINADQIAGGAGMSDEPVLRVRGEIERGILLDLNR
jgi:hypothetical protein